MVTYHLLNSSSIPPRNVLEKDKPPSAVLFPPLSWKLVFPRRIPIVWQRYFLRRQFARDFSSDLFPNAFRSRDPLIVSELTGWFSTFRTLNPCDVGRTSIIRDVPFHSLFPLFGIFLSAIVFRSLQAALPLKAFFLFYHFLASSLGVWRFSPILRAFYSGYRGPTQRFIPCYVF